MSTRRGVERGSVATRVPMEDQPVSTMFFNQIRLAKAITRLWDSVKGQSHLGGASHVVGISINVGIKIFSIVADLGFGDDHFRVFEPLLPGARALHWLHMLRRREEA